MPPDAPEEMAKVARATSIPIATGERLSTKYDFARLLDAGGAAILQMNLGRVGGLLEAKKIAGMAEVRHAQIAPHLYCGPVVGAANIQLATATPNFLILESIETWGGFHTDILKRPIRFGCRRRQTLVDAHQLSRVMLVSSVRTQRTASRRGV